MIHLPLDSFSEATRVLVLALVWLVMLSIPMWSCHILSTVTQQSEVSSSELVLMCFVL